MAVPLHRTRGLRRECCSSYPLTLQDDEHAGVMRSFAASQSGRRDEGMKDKWQKGKVWKRIEMNKKREDEERKLRKGNEREIEEKRRG